MSLETTVNWPTIDYDEPNGWINTNEGGLQVFAIWDEYMRTPTCANTAYLDMGEVYTGADGELKERLERFNLEVTRGERKNADGDTDWNFGVSAVVLLGATISSYLNEDRDEYFSVTRADLTEEGLAILEGLEALYREKATLVTFLDT